MLLQHLRLTLSLDWDDYWLLVSTGSWIMRGLYSWRGVSPFNTHPNRCTASSVLSCPSDREPVLVRPQSSYYGQFLSVLCVMYSLLFKSFGLAWFFNVFEISHLCSQRLHLFDQKYIKTIILWNIFQNVVCSCDATLHFQHHYFSVPWSFRINSKGPVTPHFPFHWLPFIRENSSDRKCKLVQKVVHFTACQSSSLVNSDLPHVKPCDQQQIDTSWPRNWIKSTYI